MTHPVFQRLMTLLRAMPSKYWEWTTAYMEMVAAVTCDWNDALAGAVMAQLPLLESWRPAPARLREIALGLAAPVPDAEAVYAEIVCEVARCGLYGRLHPSGRWYEAGPPRLSHPVVSRVVALLGGWEAIVTGEAQYAEGLKKQARAAWESAVPCWQAEASARLSTYPAGREEFPAYRFPAGYVPEAGPEPARPLQIAPARVPMPEEARAKLTALGLVRIGRAMEEAGDEHYSERA